MLSYQHIYHAGGWADIQKHAALCALWTHMMAASPARPLTYIDTHAGRGFYDLTAPEAMKVGEFQTGFSRLDPARMPKAFKAYAKALIAAAPLYPGSPGCIASLKRKNDHMHLCELHPQEITHLQKHLGSEGNVKIIKKSGHEAVLKNLPAGAGEDTLLLIDPSYEIKAEYEQTVGTALAILKRAPKAKILIWYPVLATANHCETLIKGLGNALDTAAHAVMNAPFKTPPPKGMTKSGLILLNPPHDIAKSMPKMSATLEQILKKQ